MTSRFFSAVQYSPTRFPSKAAGTAEQPYNKLALPGSNPNLDCKILGMNGGIMETRKLVMHPARVTVTNGSRENTSLVAFRMSDSLE